jgi:uncharacterized membrane protein
MPDEIGPVQLLVFGFDRPKFGGRIAAELKTLKEKDFIRIIDALVVHKNAEGDVRNLQVTDLSPPEMKRVGAVIGGLIGLGAAGDEGMEAGVAAGEEAVEAHGGHLFSQVEEWDVLDDIPNDSAAALVLLEHRWAIPLRHAIISEGGRAIGDLWLHPRDLIAAGLVGAEVAEGMRSASV